MERKKRQTYEDLPPRSDPNYMKLYNQKNRERIKQLNQQWLKQKIQDNPNYFKEKYNQEYQLEYYQSNKKRLLENHWAKIGILEMTYELFLDELNKQNNNCKICNNPMEKPQVDHCHKTGKYRGLLCVPCNNGLGVFENNKEAFEKYLDEVTK